MFHYMYISPLFLLFSGSFFTSEFFLKLPRCTQAPHVKTLQKFVRQMPKHLALTSTRDRDNFEKTCALMRCKIFRHYQMNKFINLDDFMIHVVFNCTFR
eukprot:TRINITY_DN8645_c0_g1_i1.p1 TRINITY_DN8645_c0_g1~~TRINITY_DN8645_c0_g1_i1.p1  ORF type:complete len:99 (-),score=5.39 TRINITY_DN8645_c0_g1_i1:124-420(-)